MGGEQKVCIPPLRLADKTSYDSFQILFLLRLDESEYGPQDNFGNQLVKMLKP